MAYQTISDFNGSEGAQVIFQAAAAAEPRLFPLVLFAIFSAVLFGTYFGQQRRFGRANFAFSFAAAGIFTTTMATVLSIMTGVVARSTLVICFTIAIIGVFWAMTSKERD